MDNDTLRKAIEITESYLLLAPAAVLADSFRPELLRCLSDLLGNLKPEASGTVSHLMMCIIRSASDLGGEEATKLLVADLISTNFLAKLLEGLHGAWSHHQSHGPLRELPSRAVDGVVETDYFSVLARIGLASPGVLLSALESVAGVELEKTLGWVLEEWFAHVENVGDPPSKKLMALVLTRLLETGEGWILGRLQEMVGMWTDVLGELLDGMDDRSVEYVFPLVLYPLHFPRFIFSYRFLLTPPCFASPLFFFFFFFLTMLTQHSSLFWPEEPNPFAPIEPEAPEDARKRLLIYSDPVHRVNLVAFVRDHLQGAIRACGGEERFQEEWLGRVDKDVLKGFGELGIM